MSKSSLLLIVAVAFLAPIGIVTFKNRDVIQQQMMFEPWKGQLLFFTSPL